MLREIRIGWNVAIMWLIEFFASGPLQIRIPE